MDIEKRLLESRYRMLCAEQQLEQLRVDHAMLLLEKALLEKGLDKQTIDAMILKAIEEAHTFEWPSTSNAPKNQGYQDLNHHHEGA